MPVIGVIGTARQACPGRVARRSLCPAITHKMPGGPTRRCVCQASLPTPRSSVMCLSKRLVPRWQFASISGVLGDMLNCFVYMGHSEFLFHCCCIAPVNRWTACSDIRLVLFIGDLNHGSSYMFCTHYTLPHLRRYEAFPSIADSDSRDIGPFIRRSFIHNNRPVSKHSRHFSISNYTGPPRDVASEAQQVRVHP